MTRIEKARAREAKVRAAEDMVRGPIDDLLGRWPDRPSLVIDAVLDYAIGGYAALDDYARADTLDWKVKQLKAKHGMR